MNEISTGFTSAAPRHRDLTPSTAGGRCKRVFSGIAIALITAATVVIPTQGPAQAAGASATLSGSSLHTVSSVSGATSGLKTSGASRTGYTQAVYENRLQIWANRVRHARGIRSLAVRPCDDGYAERWTRHLTRNNEFRHQDLGSYMNRCNLTGAGEILALGHVTPRRMIQMWLNSPDHRGMLLSRSYRISGIAARRDNGNWIGCIDFGRR